MKLKHKRIFVLIVKLMFCVTFAHAQVSRDSVRSDTVHFLKFSNVAKQQFSLSTLSPDYYARQLPFFCSKELQVQKAVGFPIKFRLSTVEYCDKLEGKNQ